MILIDTSAWIEFFRRKGNPVTKRRVAALVELDDAAFCGPVLYELLLGARDEEAPVVRRALEFCTFMDFPEAAWETAALIEKRLRAHGVTVPRDDILVAATALHHDIPVFALDTHFNLIAQNIKPQLRLV